MNLKILNVPTLYFMHIFLSFSFSLCFTYLSSATGNHSATLGNEERYYYCKRENDSREVAGRGWWKATSHVKKVNVNENLVGHKRPLTFHRYRDQERNRSNAIKTNWIMHEYSLESKTTVRAILSSFITMF